MYKELGEMHGQVSALQSELAEARKLLERSTYLSESIIAPNVQDAKETLDAHSFAMDHFAWTTYRREGETLEEAKIRYFASIPPAEGLLRTVQQCAIELLRAFDEFCAEHDISYWITYGTLLGAVRHQGFVPWDDDVDLGMVREDLEKLQKVIEEDNRFRITVVYDYWACCKQIRFRWADDANPCFLDLFPYDCISADHDSLEEVCARHKHQRQQLRGQERTDLAFWETCPYMPATNTQAEPLIKAFNDAVAVLNNYRTSLSEKNTCKLLWGIENVDDPIATLLPASWVFPLQRIKFETIECWAPAKPELILRQAYGDIYTIPQDIKTHYKHVDLSALNPEIQG